MKTESITKYVFTGIYTGLLCAFLSFAAPPAYCQQIVDKTVATVSDGVRTELITYSDLIWQLALIPGIPVSPPVAEDLDRVLQVVIRQRLIALDAERLPREQPSEEEIEEEIRITVSLFPSPDDFRRRLNAVGFGSINDGNFRDIIRQRIAIQKYVDFRFRSFVVIQPEEELRYYREIYTPVFRAENPDKILPKFEDVREDINKTLTDERVAADIERFIDNAETRAEIVFLSDP